MKCTYNGKEYSEGSVVCQAGQLKRCTAGQWVNWGGSCRAEDGTQLLWITGDVSDPEICATSNDYQARLASSCDVSEDTSDLVFPEGVTCAGIWAYAVGELNDNSRLVAITKNWGSGQESFNRLKACYGSNAKRATYFRGRRQIVCAPCLTCKVGGVDC